MPLDPNTVAPLLFEEEGPGLDFKREQYRFVGAPDADKSELLKDILAFVNSWRRIDAYILIGVEEQSGARANVIGVSEHLADSDLQQFVNSKVNQPITFAYRSCELEGRQIGVLHVPVQDRPRFVTKPYGKLQPNTVYVRRGSATEVARPDEISRMGADRAENTVEVPVLTVTLANYGARETIAQPLQIESLVLRFPERSDIPDYHDGPGTEELSRRMGHPTNRDYWRDLAWYTSSRSAFRVFNIAVQNHSAVAAHDVRVELAVPNALATLLDESEYPQKPRKVRTAGPSGKVIPLPTEPRVRVEYLEKVNVLHVIVPKVQPRATVWLSDSLYIAGYRNGEIALEGTIGADNMPTPLPVALKFECKSEAKVLAFSDLEHIERSRFAAEEGKALLLALQATRTGENGGG